MNKFDIEKQLNELKDCKEIKIITFEGLCFNVPYEDVKNNKEQEYIFLDALFECDKKMILYCSIKDITAV